MPPRKKIEEDPQEVENEEEAPEEEPYDEIDTPDDEEYSPPSKRNAMRKAEDKVKAVLGMDIPEVDQTPRLRSVTAHAKWSVSRKLNDANQTLDSRAYEVIITETGEMSFLDVQRTSLLLNNEATQQVAAYLDLPTEEDDSGRVIFGTIKVTAAPVRAAAPARAAAAPAKRYSGGGGGGSGRQGAGPRATSAGGAPYTGPPYTKGQVEELWGLFLEGAEDDFWDNTDRQWASIKPKNNFFADWAAEQTEDVPTEPRPLYCKSAPPKVKRILEEQGISTE